MTYAQGVDLVNSGSDLVTFLLGGGLIGFFTAAWTLFRNIRAGRRNDEESMLRRYRLRARRANEELDWTRKQMAMWMRRSARLEFELESKGIEVPARPEELDETFTGIDEEDLDEEEPETRRRRSR